MAELKIEQLTAVVDSREQMPWNLTPMQSKTGTLSVGDYSIAGMESIISLERKSLSDFVMCCGAERERFQRELDRLRGWTVSAIIIEANWSDLVAGGWRSKLLPRQVMASFASWIAQGHCLILGGDHEQAASIARGILFYAARYRVREVAELLKSIEERKATA